MVHCGIKGIADIVCCVGDVRKFSLEEKLHHWGIVEFSAFSDEEKSCFRFFRCTNAFEGFYSFNAEESHIGR